MARMKCRERELEEQRTGTSPGETQEEPGQESPHRAQNLHASQPPRLCTASQKGKIRWPPANKQTEWLQFDEDMGNIMQTISKGDIDSRLHSMTSIIISYAAERFGYDEKGKPRAPYTKNRRAAQIQQLRHELRTLKKQHKSAREDQKEPLAELRNILRKKLMTLRRAEGHRRRRKERARKRTAFLSNPFGFVKKLLGDKRSGHLSCSQEEVDQFLSNTLSDPQRDQALGPQKALIKLPPPKVDFNPREPSLKEVQEVVKRTRSASAPGPSSVPYIVYKRCPALLSHLWKILRVIWRRGRVANQWRCAEGVWIPKEENSKTIEQFRTISLLSVEGKIFFSILSRRLTEFILQNEYVDTSVQKGGIPGVPGCLEHTGVVTQLIREARESKGDLAVLWLDLTNAYGSIPHSLVEIALQKHHVPSNIRVLILDYYNNFRMRVTSGSTTSNWHRLEKGIITGCTISVTLFALAMNMVAKSAEVECRGPKTKSGTRQPPIRAFMDDLTITTSSVPGTRWILQGLEKLIAWARMSFKPSKSRSLVLKKGRVVDRFRFTLAGDTIPSISEQPVKSLGKVFDASLKDANSIKKTINDLEEWLRKVDKSGLPGRFRAWIYQHAVLPRILWPLLVYEVPMTAVESMERRISSHLRRWLGLPRSLSSAALYGSSNILQLPFSGLKEEFMVSRTREALLYRDSKDPKVSAAGIEVRTGRKWKAGEALEVAESRLRQRELVGNVARGRAGLGYFPSIQVRKAIGKDRRLLLQEEVRAGVEEERASRMVSLRQQGAWTKWESVQQRRVTWDNILRADYYRVRFLIQTVYDGLPSPANLHVWGKIETPSCGLCSGRGSLEHILSSCPKALADGRYRWRHDQVLKAVAEIVASAITTSKQRRPKSINFVKAGEKRTPQSRTTTGLLASAADWQLKVDLGKQLRFPEHIASTRLRPDMVIFSNSTKQVIMMELTVPWEERMDEAQERKRAKYQELTEECRRQGWITRCEPIEVGCRGFAGQSLCRVLTKLGILGLCKKRAIKSTIDAAERATKWLWLKREAQWSNAAGMQAGD